MKLTTTRVWPGKRVIIPIALVLAAAAVLAIVSIAYPASAAAACPSCYGFSAYGDSLYVERGASPSQLAAIKDIATTARDRVQTFYGSLRSHSRILICLTETCYEPLGGRSRGIALLDRALILSPRGTNRVIATHELSHIELHHRLGLWRTWSRAVPQWFDEGVAVTVSNDERYLKPAGSGDRCTEEPGAELPTTRGAWIETAESHGLYARAACRASRWMEMRGGSGAVPRLVDAIASGATFEAAYEARR